MSLMYRKPLPLACAALLLSACADDKVVPPVQSGEESPVQQAPTYAYDLDLDGALDGNLDVRACTPEGPELCVHVDYQGSVRTFPLGPEFLGVRAFDPIGKHWGGPLQELYVYAFEAAPGYRPSLLIFDLTSGEIRARFQAPQGRSISNTYVAAIAGPVGLYPFMAPGAGGLPASDGQPSWTHLCLFDPAGVGATDTRCGAHFRSADTMFTDAEVAGTLASTAQTFRHNGGWLDDRDGDGWEDIHLPYLWIIKMISGRTGTSLGATFHNSSIEDEPNSPQGFHSGRHYASFTTWKTASGDKGVLIAAANPVGSFQDFNCNVSRYHSLLVSNAIAPTVLSRRWSVYHGFSGPHFRSPIDPNQVDVDRPSEGIDRCPHRFSDSLFSMRGKTVTMYNQFQVQGAYNRCVAEQHAAAVDPQNSAKIDAVVNCVKSNNLGALGTWSVIVRDAENEMPLAIHNQGYVWGVAEGFFPGEEAVYLYEPLPAQLRFDRQGHMPAALWVMQGDANQQLRRVGEFPIAATPKLRSLEPTRGGTGVSWGGIPELTTRDLDGDGLVEVQLEDGTWVGFSRESESFVVK